MSKAYKCDRCGKCFDPSEDPEDVFLFLEDAHLYGGDKMDRKTGVLINYWPDAKKIFHDYDYCKDCTKIILNALNLDEKGDKKEIKQEEKKDEKTFVDILMDDVRDKCDSAEKFIKYFFSGITGGLQKPEPGRCNCETSPRESKPEQESKD